MGRAFSVCVSGHRPEKLPTGAPLRIMQSLLYSELEAAAAEGAETFYVGMARGTDLWAADIILHLRRKNPRISLVAVLPYRDRIGEHGGTARFHANAVLKAVDEIVCLGEHYYKGCFRDRNQYMVSHSQRLIALVADMHSGTGQTIRMAERAGLDIRILTPETAKQSPEPAHEFFQCEF